MFFFPSHRFPPLLIPQAEMTDWQVAGGQWSSGPSLPGTVPIVYTGPRHSWLPHVFWLEPCRWLAGVPASLETWQWAGCCVADSHLSGQRLSESQWGKLGPALLAQSIHPPFPLAHRTSRLQSGPGALARLALWDLPGYGAWDVGSDLRVWAGPERGSGALGRPRLWLQIMLHYVWTQGVWKHCGPKRLSS